MKTKKIVAGLMTTSILLSMGTGCAKKTNGGSAFGSNNKKSSIPVTSVKRDNGQQAVFELATAMSGKESMSQEELNMAYSKFIFEMMKRCA